MNLLRLKLFAALIFFLVFPHLVLAQGVDVSVFPDELRIKAETVEVIEVNIINKLNQASNFLITVFPTSMAGINIIPEKNSIYLLPGETKVVKVTLIASIDVLERIPQSLQITVSSIDFPNVKDSANVIVISERKVPVSISSLSLDKTILEPGDSLAISVGITNYASAPSEGYYIKTFITKSGEIIKTYEEYISSIPARSTKFYNYSYSIEKYAVPGRYVVQVEMRDNLNNLVNTITPKDFNVKEIFNKIKVEKSSSLQVLAATITVKLKNEGNLPVENFNFTESLPGFASVFFDPEIEPNYVISERDRVIYKWQFGSLLPGEEVTIKYSFSLWNFWAGLVSIGLVVYLFFKLTFTPVVIKSHKHKGPLTKDKDIVITLDVRNNTLHEIKDVVVRDFVPPIAKVVERFDTIRPTIKITNQGSELIWKFASLKPREERVLTYRIRPTVDIVGKLNLPSATIKYVDRKKEIKERVSKNILISGEKS